MNFASVQFASVLRYNSNKTERDGRYYVFTRDTRFVHRWLCVASCKWSLTSVRSLSEYPFTKLRFIDRIDAKSSEMVSLYGYLRRLKVNRCKDKEVRVHVTFVTQRQFHAREYPQFLRERCSSNSQLSRILYLSFCSLHSYYSSILFFISCCSYS